MCGRGVIDRQNLQNSLTSPCHPVHHLSQVSKVAHSKAFLRTKGEYRHERTGKTPWSDVEIGISQTVCPHLTGTAQTRAEHSVVALFPEKYAFVGIIHSHKLKLQGILREQCGIEIYHPFVDAVFYHRHTFGHIPHTESIMIAGDNQMFALPQLRCMHKKAHHRGVRRRRNHLQLSTVDATGKGGRIKP